MGCGTDSISSRKGIDVVCHFGLPQPISRKKFGQRICLQQILWPNRERSVRSCVAKSRTIPRVNLRDSIQTLADKAMGHAWGIFRYRGIVVE
jgi:hypothetical protein